MDEDLGLHIKSRLSNVSPGEWNYVIEFFYVFLVTWLFSWLLQCLWRWGCLVSLCLTNNFNNFQSFVGGLWPIIWNIFSPIKRNVLQLKRKRGELEYYWETQMCCEGEGKHNFRQKHQIWNFRRVCFMEIFGDFREKNFTFKIYETCKSHIKSKNNYKYLICFLLIRQSPSTSQIVIFSKETLEAGLV